MDFPRSEKKWLFRPKPRDISSEHIKKIAVDFDLPETIARILVLRGLSEKNNIIDFLNPTLQQLPRPHKMKGMNEAVAILQVAMKSQEPVTVFGDFDADGVTSTAILSLFFTELGVPSHSYIPDRLSEGYGLNRKAIRKIHDHNMRRWGAAGILLTADCGISDSDAVKEAQKLGFKVIITDHHKPPEKLPQADAILNPLQQGCSFSCKNLAGVGVAFYLILGLRSELMVNGHWPEDKIPNLKSYMDLVAIGTVADQVPVTDCNRIIVKSGLEILNQSRRFGLQKLLANAKNSDTGVTVEDIAFRLAPRINAMGRIGSAHKAVKLLTTNLADEAHQLAEELEEANIARKGIEANIYAEAVKMVYPEVLNTANSLVLYKNDWHQGVLGIVASRLSDQFFRPTILLTDCAQEENGEEVKFVKGSGRSVEGVDIHKAVSACEEILHRFGGHAGAIGLTLPADNIESFRKKFDSLIRLQSERDSSGPSIFIDLQTSLNDLTESKFLAAYTSLGPFGTGNPEPIFCMSSQKLSNLRQVGTNHLRFTIMENGKSINGIGFGFGNLAAVSQKSLMDLVFTLRLNSYMGQEKWELNIVDLRPSTA